MRQTHRRYEAMSDLAWLLVTAIFFVVALGYVWASERL